MRFHIGAELKLETEGMRKQLVLVPAGTKVSLPVSVWPAGQREFTPLLLGLYWLQLCPSAKVSRRDAIDTVIIEEPEMGLHPKAIVSFGLLLLELLERGYRVVISTHSPVVLDLVWALRHLIECPPPGAESALKEIFEVRQLSPQMKAIFEASSYQVLPNLLF